MCGVIEKPVPCVVPRIFDPNADKNRIYWKCLLSSKSVSFIFGILHL